MATEKKAWLIGARNKKRDTLGEGAGGEISLTGGKKKQREPSFTQERAF